MFRKMIFAAGAGLLLLGMTFGRDAASYLGTSIGWVHDAVRDQVPVDFELKRARQMINDLTPEVRENMHAIAREEIEVEQLAEEIDQLRLRQEKGELALRSIRSELETGSPQVQLGTTLYTSAEARELARARFDRFKTDADTLRSLQRVLAAREAGLKAARKKLDATMAAKQQLLAEVASLEARQRMNEVAQVNQDFSLDESHLARTRALIRQLETRVQVEERLTEAELNLTDELVLGGDSTSEDITDEIAGYFGDSPETETLAEADAPFDSQL